MAYEAQCRLNVPFLKDGVAVPEHSDAYKDPLQFNEGDQVNVTDLRSYGQTDDDIKRLVRDNALKEV